MTHHVGTKAECEELRDIEAKTAGLPRKGVHVGGGRHVAMTDDPQSPGWTRHVREPREHPTTKGLWAYKVADIPDDDPKLTEQEKALVQTRKASAAPLGKDWDADTGPGTTGPVGEGER